MRKKINILIVMAFLGALFLSGCGLPGFKTNQSQDQDSMVQTMVAQTLMPINVAETIMAQTMAALQEGQDTQADPQGGAQSSSPAEETPPPPTPTATQTATPTITLTPTLSVPMVQVSVDTNCRVGPGKVYDWMGALNVGEQAEVVARSADGQYWVIQNPDQPGYCWLWGYYATVDGPMANLPVWDPPPTPTPTRDWTGTWTVWVEGEGSMGYIEGEMTIHVDGDNFTGMLTILAESVDINGVVSADRRQASGTWTSPYSSGPFVFYWVDEDHFNGNYEGNLGWCGARNGAAEPDPCYVP
jgi:hypothetical protein